MNNFLAILNAKTKEELQVFSSIPSVLTSIISKPYSYSLNTTLFEFFSSIDYNNYVLHSFPVETPNNIKTISITQMKKLIRYEIVTSIYAGSNNYDCNYINDETIIITNNTNNTLSYKYKAPLYLHAQNSINTTKLVYRGVLTQLTNINYNINNESDFYLLDKYSVLERTRFTFMPKDNDPFYAQKLILLEIYNAPTVDSNAYLRNNVKNNSSNILWFSLVINSLCILTSYFLLSKSYYKKIIIILYFILCLITFIISLSILLKVNNYSYCSFTDPNNYINNMLSYNNINNNVFLSWVILTIILVCTSLCINN
jgi:hypothetical protein